jgi:hypothetical protein
MKKLFYLGLALLVVFEAANVYFIMPIPVGSTQRIDSIDLAYFLHTWRWAFRVVFGAMIAVSIRPAFAVASWRKAFPIVATGLVALVTYMVNFKMSADRMFLEPASVTMRTVDGNVVAHDRLIVGIVVNGDARAYPVNYIGYHHQVRDMAGGKPVMVSYCTVCRTGRVFEPLVDGKVESFRLVGMDHFNAMFEDHTTRSWWRQANGLAITGKLKGKTLTEIPSVQVKLSKWLERYPKSLIMQPDQALARHYSESYAYESGTSRSLLTGTDTASWNEKSWVVGLEVNGESKAFDWNQLKRERVINDIVGGTPVVIALASDTASFFAFQRPDSATRFSMRRDSLVTRALAFAIDGKGAKTSLVPIKASQEFWHSWREFHPATKRYGD